MSFQARPPAGTCLFGITIPLVGGDTLFADQHAALDAMPQALRERIEGRLAVHSARAVGAERHVRCRRPGSRTQHGHPPSDSATATQLHPLVWEHPETGRLGIFSCIGYIIGIESMDDEDARSPGRTARGRPGTSSSYRHRWEADMLIMWDNRSLLHRATGGHDGYDRLLHRTTIGAPLG
ncbi:MAG: TauD/TfdA family dioxygenase [Ilumatobacteraceae bacterium]